MNLCGININCKTRSDLLSETPDAKLIVTVNAEAIVRSKSDDKLRDIINNNYATIDGQIPLWLYRHKYNDDTIEKISGSDLIYSIPKYAEENGFRIFLLGGSEVSNDGAISKLKELYIDLNIAGYSPPYSKYPFSEEINALITKRIEEFRPHIIFVGFGMGKQEYWEADNYDFLNQLGVRLIIGCGGSFDFASGRIKRAPKIIQKCGLEGFWRLSQEFKWFRIKRLLLSTKIFYYYLWSNSNSE